MTLCLECGRSFGLRCHDVEDGPTKPADFCGRACRNAWNNRRMARGAQLYDLFMVARFDRPLAKTMKVWRYLARLASDFRQEDREERAGRLSWRSPTEIIARQPHLSADRLVQRRRAA